MAKATEPEAPGPELAEPGSLWPWELEIRLAGASIDDLKSQLDTLVDWLAPMNLQTNAVHSTAGKTCSSYARMDHYPEADLTPASA